MATNRTQKVVRVIVPTPTGGDAQTYAEVQLLAGANVTLSTSATGNRAAVTIASTAGTWSGTAIAVNKGGTGLVTYTAGDVLYATGTTTLGTTSSTTTGRSILALGAPPVGYVLGNSGSGLGWVALTVYVAAVQPSISTFTIDQASNPAAIVQSTGTIGGP
jgi:hypothetical protein